MPDGIFLMINFDQNLYNTIFWQFAYFSEFTSLIQEKENFSLLALFGRSHNLCKKAHWIFLVCKDSRQLRGWTIPIERWWPVWWSARYWGVHCKGSSSIHPSSSSRWAREFYTVLQSKQKISPPSNHPPGGPTPPFKWRTEFYSRVATSLIQSLQIVKGVSKCTNIQIKFVK